jgi:hypothetical protein
LTTTDTDSVVFLDKFTNCTGKPNPNINNATANRLRRNVIEPKFMYLEVPFPPIEAIIISMYFL